MARLPLADVAPGGWVPSAGTSLAAMINEEVLDETTSIRSSPSPNDDVAKFAVTGISGPPDSGTLNLQIHATWKYPQSKTIYMATTGLDANPGTQALPKLTLRGAFAAMASGDTLVIGNGTYTGADNCITLGQGQGDEPVVTYCMPPNGTAEAYTIVRAEHEGQVTFDGQQTLSPFALFKNDQTIPVTEVCYMEFHGLKFYNPRIRSNEGQAAAVGIHRCNAHHLKFFRCGAFCDGFTNEYARAYGTSEWSIETGHHFLFEECYGWGCGRYVFKVQDILGGLDGNNGRWTGASKAIFRRCVARLDRALAGANPIGVFMSYACPEVEFQNCIAIDIDPAYFNRGATSDRMMFSGRNHDAGMGYNDDNAYRGCIIFNVNGNNTEVYSDTVWQDPQGYWHSMNPSWIPRDYNSYPGPQAWNILNERADHPTVLRDCVAWDVPLGLFWFTSDGRWAGKPDVANCTIKLRKPAGDASTYMSVYGAVCSGANPPNLTWDIVNSVFITDDDLLDRWGQKRILVWQTAETDYSAYWTPSPNVSDVNPWLLDVLGPNDYSELLTPSTAVNPFTGTPGNGTPALLYPLRIEAGSNLKGTGQGGADRGANIIYRYGVSGTLWGDPGYNTLTDELLWPFPYEAQIRADMRTYNFVEGPSGTRGFCAEGESLTHYLWNALGNGNPYE